MNIREYKNQVQRTLPDLGSKILNSIHMTLGISSELFEELISAMDAQDKVNIAEELADVQWYLCNYATIHGIELPEIINPEIDWQFKGKHEVVFKSNYSMFDGLKAVGRLNDFDKKELAYGKVIPSNDSARVQCVMFLFEFVEHTANSFKINMNEARKRVINKLKLRYPDKFDCDKAINRDVVAERKILEGGNDEN